MSASQVSTMVVAAGPHAWLGGLRLRPLRGSLEAGVRPEAEAPARPSAPQSEPGGGLRCPRMGILFIRIWRLFNHQEHKVIIVGLDNAGKTTILYQFSMNEVVHTSPTIGSNVEEIVVNNTHFLMWDIGGKNPLVLPGTRTTLTRVCNSCCGQHRQRKNFCNQRRALQNASPRGPKKSWVADFC